MLIKTGFDIAFTAEQATPMVIMLSIHPSRIADIIGGEQIVAEFPAASEVINYRLFTTISNSNQLGRGRTRPPDKQTNNLAGAVLDRRTSKTT